MVIPGSALAEPLDRLNPVGPVHPGAVAAGSPVDEIALAVAGIELVLARISRRTS